MRTKTYKPRSVNVVTLGCSKNLVDSEVLMGQLVANDFDVTHEAKRGNSEIVIINTCGYIDNAKQESIDTILHYANQKQKGKIDKLIVTGCLSERYKPELEKEISTRIPSLVAGRTMTPRRFSGEVDTSWRCLRGRLMGERGLMTTSAS